MMLRSTLAVLTQRCATASFTRGSRVTCRAVQGVRGLCTPSTPSEMTIRPDSEMTIAPLDGSVEPKVIKIAEEICTLNLLQLADLSTVLKEKLGIDDSMLYGAQQTAAAPVAAAAAPEVEEVEEKTEFDLKLTGFDAKQKIKVIKAVREVTSLGLKEAKEVVEGAPSLIKEGIKKEEAEELAKKLKEVGAEIEIA